MLALLTSLLSGGTLSLLVGLGSKIADLYIAKNNAASEVEKALIQQQIEQLKAQQSIVLSAQSNPFTRTVYWTLLAIAASGPVAYITKVFLWDKTIGAFYGCSGHSGDLDPNCHIYNTDVLGDPNLWWIAIAVFGFLFLTTKAK